MERALGIYWLRQPDIEFLLASLSAAMPGQRQAIGKVIHNHPGFPMIPNGVSQFEYTSNLGPAVPVKFKIELKTLVEEAGNGTHLVTFMKDYNTRVNGEPITAWWKYRVTPSSWELVERQSNEIHLATIK